MNKFYLLFLMCSLSFLTSRAQVTDVVSGLTFPYDAALYGDDLYITELGAGRIIKIDITAPAPPTIEVVLSGLGNPAAMTISGDILYYAESSFDRVSKIDLTQTDPTPEIVTNTGLATPNDLLVDGNFLYITDEGVDRLLRVDLTEENPVPVTIASGLSNPLGIAKFGDDLYLSIFGSSSIVKVDITENPAVVTTIASGFSQPAGVTVDGGFLYIAENNKVSRIDLTTTMPTAETIVTDGINGSRNVAFDGIDLYIAQTGGTFGGTGLISKLTIGTPVFSGIPNVCVDDMPTMLGGASPSSGIYSGPGVTDNGDGTTFTFDPVAAGGLGTYTVTYNLNGNMVTSMLTVVASPTVTFSTGGLSVTDDAGVQTGLGGGMPAGGVYSGNGVTDDGNGMTYSFDPAVAGQGENVVTYTYADANGCGGAQGAIITVTAGVPGAALDFDGVDDRVLLPAANLLGGITGDYTISAWVNIDNNTVNQPVFTVVSGETSSSFAPLIVFGANFPGLGNRPYIILNPGSGDQIVSGSQTLTVNEWHHLVASYDAATTTMTLYVDGEEVGSGTVTSTPSDITNPFAGYIGHYSTIAPIGGYFSGQIDEVRILSTGTNCFAANQLRDCELPDGFPNLEAYYKFNQGSGGGSNTSITELTATAGPNGTLEGFALTGANSNFVAQGGVVSGTICDPVNEATLTVTNVDSGMAISNGEDMPSTDNGTDIGNVAVGPGITGTTSFQLAGDAITAADITSSSPFFTFTLSPEGVLTVIFTPDAEGIQSTEMMITTNDCTSSNLFTFVVQGTGVELEVPGDDCAEAIDISAQFGQEFNVPQTTSLYDNTNFTVGANDPAEGIDCFYNSDPLQNTGWFSFTGDGNTYRVRSVECTGMNPNLDLQAAVYSGTCGSLTDVACNEDEDGGNGIFNFNVEFATEEGVEYLILVDGFDGEAGEFCIEVTNLTNSLLPGEMCSNAIDISALTGQAEMAPQVSDQYDNTEYGTDATDPPADPTCNGSLDRSIWFNFTGDGNRYTIKSLGDADMSANIYTGECESLTLLTCNDDDPAGGLNFLLEFQTELGVNYSVIVDDRGTSGSFNLEVTNQGSVGVTNIATTDLRVFPNPTNGLVQLPQLELERVEAYDATGRLVLNQQQPGTSIDLGAQPAGLYILKMYAGQEVYSAKVVKE